MKGLLRAPLKGVVCLLSLVAVCSFGAFASGDDARLKIFSAQTKGEIVKKMKDQKWAGETLNQAHKQVDKYVDIHQTDTTWVLSRLQMYWKNRYTTPYINGAHYSRAEGSAPVPTVRFTGGRDWATDWATPSLEETVPYMDYRDDEIYLQNNKKPGKPWEWVPNSQTAHQIETINQRIVDKAMYAAFIYWLSGEEKYAKFAYDILVTYTDGMYYREAPISEIDHRNAHLVGYTSFEVIHERVINSLPLCYDLLYDYIIKQNGDTAKMHAVFQKFADQIIVNGVSTNNWNVFQACFVTYLALTLEDDAAYENGRGKQYYIDFILNKSVPRQKALREVCDIYDQNTGMWNESPGYSTSTTKDLAEILLLIDGMENKDILKDFAIVEKAVMASFEYLLPNKMLVSFGDNQYSPIDYAMFESLLALYAKYDKTEKMSALSAILNEHIAAGMYDREKGSSLYKLFSYVDTIDANAQTDESPYSTLFYAPNVNLTIQRSGMDRIEGLMLTNAGTGFNHNHNNGINMELYGKGYPLAVDKARGSSYWVADHGEYYKATISHNTVLIDGVSSNSSPEMKPGEVSPAHKLHSNFPEYNQKDSNDPYVMSYVDNEFLEKGTQTMQRRVNGIVRTSPTSGYYVDIFRSAKINGGDKKHEYLYHNAGQVFNIFDTKGQPIAMTESTDLTSAGGQVKGYDYITDKKEVEYSGDFQGTFELNLDGKKDDVRMDVWMKGEVDRKLFSVMTPRALKGLGGEMTPEVESAPIPAMIVRQNGEAWSRPFVAIYEPYTAKEGKTIESVNYIDSKNSDFVGIEVVAKTGAKEYIFNCTGLSVVEEVKSLGAKFQAAYGVVSICPSKNVSYMFLGNGQLLSYGNYSVESATPNATALIEWVDGGLKVKSDAAATLRMPLAKGASTTLNYVDCKGEQQSISGTAKRGVVEYSLPALNNVILK
ncbi:MAG: heparinase II/III family protein [Rikenellaceae bacterium]